MMARIALPLLHKRLRTEPGSYHRTDSDWEGRAGEPESRKVGLSGAVRIQLNQPGARPFSTEWCVVMFFLCVGALKGALPTYRRIVVLP